MLKEEVRKGEHSKYNVQKEAVKHILQGGTPRNTVLLIDVLSVGPFAVRKVVELGPCRPTPVGPVPSIKAVVGMRGERTAVAEQGIVARVLGGGKTREL